MLSVNQPRYIGGPVRILGTRRCPSYDLVLTARTSENLSRLEIQGEGPQVPRLPSLAADRRPTIGPHGPVVSKHPLRPSLQL
jgi:hypothetical protein